MYFTGTKYINLYMKLWGRGGLLYSAVIMYSARDASPKTSAERYRKNTATHRFQP